MTTHILTQHDPQADYPVAEAVEVGARAWFESVPGGASYANVSDAIKDRSRPRIAAVLEAVGYADLLAEVGRLRGSADAWWTEYDKALTEGKRLQRIINGYDRTPAEQRAADAEAEVVRLRAGIEWLDLDVLEDVAFNLGHTVYEATELEPAECTDECEACCIEDTVVRLRALLDGAR